MYIYALLFLFLNKKIYGENIKGHFSCVRFTFFYIFLEILLRRSYFEDLL
jgi:hypothetical protein